MASRQYATFEVDGQLFGLDVAKVQEVLSFHEYTSVPLAPEAVGGLFNLRGQVIAAVDMRVQLGLSRQALDGPVMNLILRTDDGPVSLLVAPMLRGNRELIAGLHQDPQFGPTVMLGVGGILAEAVADVAFRLVPLTPVDAEDLVDDLATQSLLGEFRGEPAVDRDALVAVVTGLAALAEARPDVTSVDLNPLIVVDGRPIAVDALVEVRA